VWCVVLRKMLRISKQNRITSLADFIASRYGKSALLGGLVTVIAVIGILPYISLQLKAVSNSFTILVQYPEIIMPSQVGAAPMREDTGFLFGSITKALTTTLVLQQVERGLVDLDERVVTYLPEFHLSTPSAAEKIRVRNLLTHTDGIDADLFFPDAKGRGALTRIRG